MYVKNIYDYRNKDFFNFNELKYLYNLNSGDFLKYYSLIGNISIEWKNALKTETINNATPEYLITKVVSTENANKILYNKQIESMRQTTLKHIIKWENEIGVKNMEWKKIFSLPYVCTISTKLRAFQYKYLMRIIPNNYFLFTCKLRPSNLCDFCDSFPDSNKHMFWECGQVQSYWSDISQLLKRNILDYDTDLTYETISFCTTKIKPKQKSVLTSFIIMLAKYFIFKCK